MEKFPDVLELNVGGKKITTFLSTVTKEPNSMLAAMFSGRHVISKDEKGRYFLDCDGETFGYILNYLRFGTLPSEDMAVDVHALAVYYGIHSLENGLESFISVQRKIKINKIKTGSFEEGFNVLQTEFPDVLELNVGGKKITTLLSTVTKEPDSMLAAMFSGRHVINTDEKGRYFLDCDGETFGYILNYLRFGTLPSEDEAIKVHAQSVYFGIHSLKNELESFKAVQKIIQINEIKTGPDAKKYNVIKTEIFKVLKYCHSYEDINLSLHMPYDVGRELTIKETALRSINFREICLRFQVDLSGDLIWCLTEELHARGFGRFIYLVSYSQHRCICGYQSGLSILLSTQKLNV